MAFTYITVTCDYDLGDGTDPSGTVTFTPTVAMTNAGVVVAAASIMCRLDVDGLISVSLAANTDPSTTTPAGTSGYYRVDECINDSTRSYYVQIPYDQGATVSLYALGQIDAPPPGIFGFSLDSVDRY